jgi:tetraprenyl-beta-curcumene synthase
MPRGRERRPLLLSSFARGARSYWLSVFAQTRRERHRWQGRAEGIPSNKLRQLALEAHEAKAGNVEGATAFAAFVEPRWRKKVIRAQVAFQSAYDYLDTLAEQPSSSPASNAHQLHLALLAACDRSSRLVDYYAYNEHCEDAGYLAKLIEDCRRSLEALPSWSVSASSIRRLARRIVAYQSLNLTEAQGGQAGLARWAERETPTGADLAWWETAASAGSSLGVFALIAASAQDDLSSTEANSIEQAYWPWIGALHSLLDSLVDLAQDSAAGQRSLLDNYESREEAAQRLREIAELALGAADRLPRAQGHVTVLTAMATFYLAGHKARGETERLVAREIMGTFGPACLPSALVFRARRAVARESAARA